MAKKHHHQAPVQGATAEEQARGRGALPKAYPKTAEGLQRLDTDIKELGAEQLGLRHGVTHHAVLQHRKRLRKSIADGVLPLMPQHPVEVVTATEGEIAPLTETGGEIYQLIPASEHKELIEWLETYRYLLELGRENDRVVFVIFPPEEGPCIHIPVVIGCSSETMQPPLGELERLLQAHPEHGLGIVVNPSDPQPQDWGIKPEQRNKKGKPKVWGASNRHISKCLVAFGECDGTLSIEEQERLPLRVGLPPATFTVSTTGRSLHHYWVVEGEPLEPHEFRTLQRRIARYLGQVEEAGADSSICNPARVMRVPGSIHPRSGGRVHIHSKGGPRYEARQLLERIPPLSEETESPKRLQGEPRNSGWFGRMHPERQREMAVSMVRQLPLRQSKGKGLYERSLAVLAGMVHHFGTEEAVSICLEAGWSDPDYWPVQVKAESIDAHGAEAAAIGSLILWARECGWVHPNAEFDAELQKMIEQLGATQDGVPLRDALDAQDREELKLRFSELRASMGAAIDLRDVFPSQLADALIEAAKAMPVDPVALLGPVLCAIAATAGTRVEVFVKNGWREPLVLWMANVLRPGAMKSPIAGVVAQPMHRMEAAWRNDWEQLMREGGEFVVADANDPGQPPATEPVRRIVLGDCTYERAVELMSQKNIPGLLSLQDELGGFFAQFQRNPAARSGWLSLWSGGPAALDRKTTKSAYAPKTATSLFGNMQPDKLASLLAEETGHQSEGGDGLWSRFLWCRPRETVFTWNRAGVDVTAQVHELLESVDQQLQGYRLRLRVDLEVMDEFVGPLFEQWARDGVRTNSARSAFLSKLRGYTIRFMGVLCLLELAVRSTADWRNWLNVPCDVDEFHCDYEIDRGTMLRAVTLARFFLAQWDALQPEVAPSEFDGPPQWVAKFLRKVKDGDHARVTPRDLLSWKLDKRIDSSARALAALKELEEKWGHGVVKQGKRKDQFWWTPSTAELLN